MRTKGFEQEGKWRLALCAPSTSLSRRFCLRRIFQRMDGDWSLNPQFPALDETTSIHDCKTPGAKRLCGWSVDDPVDKLLRDVQIGLLTS